MGTISGPHSMLDVYYIKKFFGNKNKQDDKNKEKENKDNSTNSR